MYRHGRVLVFVSLLLSALLIACSAPPSSPAPQPTSVPASKPAPASQPTAPSQAAAPAQPTLASKPAAAPTTAAKPEAKPAGLSGSIKLGSILALTGGAAFAGTAIRDGMQLAMDEINGQKYLGDATVAVIFEDTAGKNDVAVNAVKKLLERDKIVGLAGATISQVALTYTPIVQQAKVPFIIANSPLIGMTKDGDYIFSIDTPQEYYAEATIGALMAKGIKKPAFIVQSDNQPIVSVGNFFRDSMAKRGVQTVAWEEFLTADKNLAAQLTKIQAAGPDALGVMGMAGQAAAAAVQARQRGINAQFFGHAAMAGPAFAENAGPAANGTIYSTNFDAGLSNPRTQKFVAAFKAKFDRVPDQFAAHGYDSIWMLAQAIKESGKADAQAMQQYLVKLKTYDGASGQMTFESDRVARVKGVCQVTEGVNKTKPC